MPDNLKRRAPEDKTRISLREAWEVTYWTETLGVSAAKLQQAVAAAGNSVTKVKEWLKGH